MPGFFMRVWQVLTAKTQRRRGCVARKGAAAQRVVCRKINHRGRRGCVARKGAEAQRFL
jgi:hypothetical protein